MIVINTSQGITIAEAVHKMVMLNLHHYNHADNAKDGDIVVKTFRTMYTCGYQYMRLDNTRVCIVGNVYEDENKIQFSYGQRKDYDQTSGDKMTATPNNVPITESHRLSLMILDWLIHGVAR